MTLRALLFLVLVTPAIAADGPFARANLHAKDDPGISFMISDGRVARVDVEDAHHATVSGVRVGDTERTVKRLYRGRYSQSPHHYIGEGHYFTIRSRDRKYALVIETDGQHVVYIRCGLVPEAESVERCL